MATRVYIVEDHPAMRETLRDFLATSSELELCGEAATAEDAAAEIEEVQPAVVLVDLSLPGQSGLDLLEEVRRRWGVPCVVISGHRDPSYVGRALAAGARGYVLKGGPADIPAAIRAALRGEVYLSEGLRRALDYAEDEEEELVG